MRRSTKGEAVGSHRRCHGERGASLVEFALVLPVLALILFGIIDFGMAYNDYQALRNGVRNGTRDAVVINYGSTTSCASSPSGGTVSGPAQNIICRVKDQVGLGNNVRVGVWAPGGWTPGASLRVCAQSKLSSTTGITSVFLDGKVTTVKVEMRIEQDLSATDKPAWVEGQEAAWTTTWPSNCTS